MRSAPLRECPNVCRPNLGMPFADAADGGYRNISRLKSLMKKNLLRILMPALIVGMTLMSALTVQASARYGFFIFPHLQQGIANASAQPANRINAYHTNTTDIPAALLVRMSRHIAPGHFGLGAVTRIRAAADVRAGIRAGAGAGADMRIKAADVQHSRPDRSVDRNLEDFVATLSGIELVLLVLAIVLPVSVITPLLAVLLFGRRCDRCGRLHAMRDTAHSRHGDTAVTKNGQRVYKYVVTRTCRHCGHTDSHEQTRN